MKEKYRYIKLPTSYTVLYEEDGYFYSINSNPKIRKNLLDSSKGYDMYQYTRIINPAEPDDKYRNHYAELDHGIEKARSKKIGEGLIRREKGKDKKYNFNPLNCKYNIACTFGGFNKRAKKEFISKDKERDIMEDLKKLKCFSERKEDIKTRNHKTFYECSQRCEALQKLTKEISDEKEIILMPNELSEKKWFIVFDLYNMKFTINPEYESYSDEEIKRYKNHIITIELNGEVAKAIETEIISLCNGYIDEDKVSNPKYAIEARLNSIDKPFNLVILKFLRMLKKEENRAIKSICKKILIKNKKYKKA